MSPQRVIQSTLCYVLDRVQGFRGRQIEWHYFRLDQTQPKMAAIKIDRRYQQDSRARSPPFA